MVSLDQPGLVYGLFHTADPERVRYIGVTRVSAAYRIKAHRSARSLPKNKMLVTEWIRGMSDPSTELGIVTLESGLVEPDLSSAEAKWILHYGPEDLLNARGGGLRMYQHEEPTRDKISDARLALSGPDRESLELEYRAGGVRLQDVAHKYGVSKSTVWRIVNHLNRIL